MAGPLTPFIHFINPLNWHWKDVIYGADVHKSMAIHCIKDQSFESNIYLVTGDRPVLIDTGTGRMIGPIMSRLRELVDISTLDRIVLTHRHYDHVGGARDLSDRLEAKVFMHEADSEPVRNGDDQGTLANEFLDSVEPLDVIDVREGEVISTGEHDLRVIHTPGHTIGSICLFDDSNRALISGDTLFVGSVGRWDLPTGDIRLLKSSLLRLKDLGAESLYPGHGPFVEDGAKHQIEIGLRYLGV